MAAILVSAKVSVFFSKIKKTFPKSSQRFYLAQTLIKHKKHNHKSSMIFLTLKNRKQKAKINFTHWVASQQALSFNAPS